MYAIAGQAAEVLTGEFWEDLLLQQFFGPLEMDSTTFYHRAAPEYENFAKPYATEPENRDQLISIPIDTWSGVGAIGPAASVCSTANDMALWLRFILSGGATDDGDQIVDSGDLERVWQAETSLGSSGTFMKPEYPVTDVTPTYSLAYTNGYYREYRYHSHGGDLQGYHSMISFFPDMDFGSFFSTNYGNHSYERQLIHQFVADVMLGEEPWNTAEEACQIIEELRTLPNVSLPSSCPATTNLEELVSWLQQNHDLPSTAHVSLAPPQASCLQQFSELVMVAKRSKEDRDLEAYEGEFGNFGFGNLTVFYNETTQLLELQYGELGQFDLHPTTTEDLFMGRGKENSVLWYRFPVVFEESETGSGNVDLVTVPLFEITMPPVFERGLQTDSAPPPRIHDCT